MNCMGKEKSNVKRRELRASVLLAPLLLALLLTPPTAHAQAKHAPPGDSDSALTLARRLLAPWGDNGGITVELTPRELPTGLPSELPLPAELTLVGSMANYGPDGELLHGQVVLDSRLPAAETQRLLQESFANRGWKVQPQPGPAGFVPQNTHVAALYCGPEGLSFIHMNSFGSPESHTDVRLEVNTQTMYSPCGDGSARSEEPQPSPLPTLSAPAATEVTLHGGNFVGDQASSSAVLETEIPADELLRHFETQLEEAGWQRLEGQGQSGWTRLQSDRTWHGVLEISEIGEGTGRFYAAFVIVADLATN